MKLFQCIGVILLIGIISFSCSNSDQKGASQFKTDSNGFTYESFKDDPTGLRLYTLDNGFKVYLSQNHDEPKIQTYIAVKAGSNYDPKDATGLAHYLEHMVFKGTHEFGTLDWEKEKTYLEKISDLYEAHKATDDPEEKLALYKQIDEVSLEASNYSIANEYDKMIASLGATGTNAYTWFEQTVYTNKIPANELDKWLHVESARFQEVVLRLFHTELEAVFEEFNRGQDNDFRKSYAAMLDELFPSHPYGQQTTIGEAEHLKNPSMVAIHNYFDKYYVPSNMAVVLVGDFELVEIGSAIAISSFLPLCHLKKGNVIVDFITAKLNFKKIAFLDCISSVIYGLIALFFTWRMFFGAKDMYNYQEETMLLQFPIWIPFLPVTFSFGLLSVCCLYTFYRELVLSRS